MKIAIDGPAGAGKSSIARLAAERLSFVYIDTGAMYRTMTLYCMQNGVDVKDEDAVTRLCDSIEIKITYENGEQQIFLGGKNVSKEIRKEEVGNKTSLVASYGKIRKKMVVLQHELARNADVIMDGRDIGTVVLPDAEVKVYLTASPEVRAQRRYKELVEKGVECDIKEIEKDIVRRDEQDMNRENSPLKQAEDAVLIDSSNMSINEVVEKICSLAGK